VGATFSELIAAMGINPPSFAADALDDIGHNGFQTRVHDPLLLCAAGQQVSS
jgi:hypothetical protein